MIRRWRRIRIAMAFVMLVILISGSLSNNIPSASAETCSWNDYPNWPPHNWGYTSSVLSLSGQSYICFSNPSWSGKGITYGAAYGNQPINSLRIQMQAWETVGGSVCGTVWQADSGWIYGQLSNTGRNGWRDIACTGTASAPHGYASIDTHTFGQGGQQAQPGYNQ